jgi:hypothetical protein
MRCSLKTRCTLWTKRAVCSTIICSVFLAIALVLSPTDAFAQSGGPQIFDMRKNLPLESDEPVYHDFYISGGAEAGFKKGLYVTVVRQVPVHDPIQNKQQATLNVTIGKLQIVHVEKGLAVGRVHSETGDDERPTVEFEGIMIGDRVELAGSSMEAPAVKKRPAAKKRIAAAPVEMKVEARIETAKAEVVVEKPAPPVEIKGEVAGLSQKAQAVLAPKESAKKDAAPVSIPVPAPKGKTST